MMKTITIKILCILLLCIQFISCKKEIPDINGFPDFELSGEINENILQLNWTKSNNSDFLNYVILGSIDTIPDSLYLALDNDPVFSFRVDNQSNHSLDTSFAALSPLIYFKVFVELEENIFFPSNMISFEFEGFQKLPFFANEVFPDPDNQAIIVLDESLSKLIRYDYINRTVLQEIEMTEDISFGTIEKWNGDSELYLTGEQNDVKILDALTLETKAVLSTGNHEVLCIDTNDDGLIAATMDWFSSPIAFFDRENLNILNSHFFNGAHLNRGVCFLSKEEKIGIEMSYSGKDKFQLNDAGQIISHQSSNANNGSSSLNYELMVASPEGNYFVATREGHLYDKDLNDFGKIPGYPNRNYVDFVFVEEETFLYTVNDNFMGNDFLLRIKIPELEIVETLTLGYNPLKLFIDDGKIFVIGKIENSMIIQECEW